MSQPADAPRSRIQVVVGLIEDDRGRVLVNQRRPGTHMAGFWEFPGGKRGPREGREEALRRELHEELGIRLLAASPLVRIRHDYPDRSVHLDVWRVWSYAGDPEPREDQALRWSDPRELPRLGLLPADAPIVEALLRDRNDPDSAPGTSQPSH